MARANVFVLGLDELNHQVLRELPDASRYRFHPLLSVQELQHREEIPLDDLLTKAEEELDSFDGSVDAIVGYWDFPVSSMVPILNRRRGLRSTSLESVLRCEHKYWSRLEQREVIEDLPRFDLVDLDAPAPPSDLRYPIWLKPVKSFSSELAFHVADDQSFATAVEAIRADIGRVGEPFEFVLRHAELPATIAEVGAQACLAEEALHGQQVTLEGYARNGEVTVYGVVDSVMFPDSPSFLRYQYPSTLPSNVVDRMTASARRVIAQVGLDHSTFNIEFFYDAEKDSIGLLEVNPRHSQSHARLFEHVDGVSNHQVMLRLALGDEPHLPHRKGEYAVAAKWFVRRFADGLVRSCPTDADIARLEQDVPGTKVRTLVKAGDRLSDLHGQDSYSYEVAQIHIGAHSEAELTEKYERSVDLLPFEFDDIS